jgi:hypothetical protein
MRKREEEINKFSKERIKIGEGGGITLKDILVGTFSQHKC